MSAPAASEEMERNQPSATVGPSATPPYGDGFRAARYRRGLRFAGAVLLFLGILAAVGILTALMVFPDPLAVPERDFQRGWLVILGAVAATGVVLLGAAAPRAGYRWFDGALFLVPLYGQVIFAPRLLWLGSRSKGHRPRAEPSHTQPTEGSATAATSAEPAEPPDPERIREEVRTLAALLSGRGQFRAAEARGATGPAAAVVPAEPVEALDARVSELRTELSRLRAELEQLRQQLRSLEDQLRRGREPPR